MKNKYILKNFFKYPKSKKFKRFAEGGLRKNKKKIVAKPIFSIITVVLNNEKYLEESIKSVISQKIKSYEHIIIDGGSVDNSLNIIRKYQNKITYWLSERDLGIYHAFNKGLELTRGEYIIILNSDDIFTKNALLIYLKYIKKYKSIDFIFGAVKKHWGTLYGYKPEKIWFSWGFYSSHSSGFCIKSLSAKKIGLYNLRYKYHADYDYFYRMIVHEKMKGIATKKNEIVGIFRRGGFSSTIPLRKLFFEEILIRYNNGQNLILLFLLSIYKLYIYLKKLVLK